VSIAVRSTVGWRTLPSGGLVVLRWRPPHAATGRIRAFALQDGPSATPGRTLSEGWDGGRRPAGFGTADAVDKARAALTVSDACPDAHVLLALYDAASLDDALQHYRTAEACAPAALQAGEKLVDTLESVPVRRVPRANTPTDGVVCSGVCVCVCVDRRRRSSSVPAVLAMAMAGRGGPSLGPSGGGTSVIRVNPTASVGDSRSSRQPTKTSSPFLSPHAGGRKRSQTARRSAYTHRGSVCMPRAN